MTQFIIYILVGVVPLVITIGYGVSQNYYIDLVIGYYFVTLLAVLWLWYWTIMYHNTNKYH